MKPAAFQATIHGFRTVPSRGVVSITIEAPIEHHAELAKIAVHGAWVAVARLEEPKEEKPEKEKATWRDLTPAAQAALRCKEPMFRAFLGEKHGHPIPLYGEDETAEAVRTLCGIGSRSELSTNHKARVIWHQLDSEYQAWKIAS